MALKVSHLFTQDDLERIKATVHEAERRTSGEIVPYVVEQSDPYHEPEWRGGLLLGFLALLVFVAVRQFTTVWLPLDFVEVALAIALASGGGILLARYVQRVKRLLAGHALMDRRVHQRASEAFLSEEVFNTRDRTGILIFLSLLEHKVLVLGDSGINARVQQADWQDIVQRVVNGIRSGKPAEGLIDAIQQCGALLQKHGVEIRPDDKDELSDSLRVGDT